MKKKIRYPLYIISKGRWEKTLTANALGRMGVPYKIVVEPSEYSNYCSALKKENVLKLPDNFSERKQGSIPVRNWVWEHSISNGFKKHWVIDDNIQNFYRLNKNRFGKVLCDGIFRASEDFVDRYENIAISGFEYLFFAGGEWPKKPPFRLNHRVYSTLLIDNSLPFRWRGKFNEDTDLCIRALKSNFVTLTFLAFAQDKTTTLRMKGGNTDTIYNETDNRLEFAESLQKQHPDCVKVVRRYNRWHHDVDFSKFSNNKLIKRKNLSIPDRINNYNMKLVVVENERKNSKSKSDK